METTIGRPADIAVTGILNFRTTEVSFEGQTAAGRAFIAEIAGQGAVGVTVLKSVAGSILERIAERGLLEVVS